MKHPISPCIYPVRENIGYLIPSFPCHQPLNPKNPKHPKPSKQIELPFTVSSWELAPVLSESTSAAHVLGDEMKP